MRARAALAVATLVAGTACGGDDTNGGEDAAGEAGSRYPAVLEAELAPDGDGTYDVAVTISSEYDSEERYADGWRVLDPDGDVLGEHGLSHNHASEQPFTRIQTGLEVPDDVDTVTVEGRDSDNGYGGETAEVEVPAG